MDDLMRLYHFTAGEWLRRIANHGLTVGDVPTDFATMAGTVGVWFTTSPSPKGHGLGGTLNKERFRLSVDVPLDRLHRWTDWAEENVTLPTRLGLSRSKGRAYDTWYVCFGRIAPERIVKVEDTRTEAEVANWHTVWPENMSLPGVSYEGRFIWQKRMLQDVKRALKARGR